MPLTKIKSLGITDGTIVNADINASAAIASTKLSGVANTPAFGAVISTNTTITNSTATKIPFNSEVFDTDGAYDPTTNYRFTVPADKAGKYLVTYGIGGAADSATTFYRLFSNIYKNGAAVNPSAVADIRDAYGFAFSNNVASILDLSVGDYLEVYAYLSTGNTANLTATRCYFNAFRLIGV